jgi:replicative superfamily II helicase
MSATLPNVGDLALWLEASLYSTSFRPVNLETRLCFASQLHKVKPPAQEGSAPVLQLDRALTPLLAVPKPAKGRGSGEVSGGAGAVVVDDDGFLSLCAESVSAGRSLMVFCSSKKRCGPHRI